MDVVPEELVPAGAHSLDGRVRELEAEAVRFKAAELATQLLADNFPDLDYWLKLATGIERYLRGEEGPAP